MLITCDETKARFSPLDWSIRSADRADFYLGENGKFIVDFYSVERETRRTSSRGIRSLIERLPETKRLQHAHGMYEAYEIPATDCNVELLHYFLIGAGLKFYNPYGYNAEASQAWLECNPLPASVITWKDAYAKTIFDGVLLKSQLADDTARMIAAYKESKTVPEHSYVLNHELPLAEYQQVPLCALMRSEGFGLFMDTGTGKTPVVIAAINNAANELRARGETRILTVIIAVPKNLRTNWVNEIHQFATHQGRCTVIKGTAIQRAKCFVDVLQPDPTGETLYSIAICSYQTLWRSREALQFMHWDMAYLDEAQAIKDPKATQSKAALQLRDTSDKRCTLTGTPIANSIMDMYMQLEFMQKGGSGFSSFEGYKEFYGVYERNGDGRATLAGCQNLPFLHERLARMSYHITKKEALPNLPEQTFDIVECDMSEEQRSAYDKLSAQLAIEIEVTLASNIPRVMMVNNILTQLLRLSQITSGFMTWQAVEDIDGNITQPKFIEYFNPVPKLEQLIDDLLLLPQDEKAIVWSCWLPDIDYIQAACQQNGLECVVFTGELGDDERDAVVKRFNADRKCRVFIGTPGSGGAGLNLIGYPPREAADYDTDVTFVAYYCKNWSRIHRAQSKDRAYRKGTRRRVHVRDYLCPYTIDTMIQKRLDEKDETANEVSDLQEILQAIHTRLPSGKDE